MNVRVLRDFHEYVYKVSSALSATQNFIRFSVRLSNLIQDPVSRHYISSGRALSYQTLPVLFDDYNLFLNPSESIYSIL